MSLRYRAIDCLRAALGQPLPWMLLDVAYLLGLAVLGLWFTSRVQGLLRV
ncbi:MAG: hypothetical protein WAM30_20510 [Candidatus Dormiibacterota bacterium]